MTWVKRFRDESEEGMNIVWENIAIDNEDRWGWGSNERVDFDYSGNPVSINEAMSDCYGSLIAIDGHDWTVQKEKKLKEISRQYGKASHTIYEQRLLLESLRSQLEEADETLGELTSRLIDKVNDPIEKKNFNKPKHVGKTFTSPKARIPKGVKVMREIGESDIFLVRINGKDRWQFAVGADMLESTLHADDDWFSTCSFSAAMRASTRGFVVI